MLLQIWINDKYVLAPKKMSILQACRSIDNQLPHFCYHENLSIAGNCRMCLVEINDNKKLQVGCSTEISANMFIYTNNLRVKKANESVLEFLLINHPLDCPICDQGGECDLQDLSMFFGSDRGRFYEIQKRSVQDKYLGSLVKTVMTRCIHCTRCVRFLQEISGDYSLGVTGRGGTMEITTYIRKNLHEELSGNIIDICPVGALTSKPYAFKARPWEAKQISSVDIFDSLCSSIRIDVFNNKILRILPVSNSYLNEDWITNKIRFCYDCFNIQRITSPIYRIKKNFLLKCSWKKIFKYLSLIFFQSFIHNIESIFGDINDLTCLQSLKDFLNSFGCSNIKADTFLEKVDFRSNYLLNTSIHELEYLNLVILIGVNARFDFPLLNLRFRKRFLKGDFHIYTIGQGINYLTFPVENLGNITSLFKFIRGTSKLSKLLLKNKKSRIFLGKSNIKSFDYNIIFKILNICNKFTKQKEEDLVCVLENQTGLLGSYDLGLLCSINNTQSNFFSKKLYSFFFILNNSNFLRKIRNQLNKFIVYIDSHGDKNVSQSNIILPATTFVESEGLYVNLEGLTHITNAALPMIGDSRNYKLILKALHIYLLLTNKYVKTSNLVFDKIDMLSSDRFIETLPVFKYSKYYIYSFYLKSYNYKCKLNLKLYDSAIYSYYKSSSILKNSVLLLNINELVQTTFSENYKKF